MNYFNTRQLVLFYSYALDAKEEKKLTNFLDFLDKSNVAEILLKVRDKQSEMGRPSISIFRLFATVLYGFAFSDGSLRNLESLCRYDLRFMYLMENEKPSYKTFSNFINRYILPHSKEIFDKLMRQIIKECDFDLEDIFIDGTKIEANANKYKFVWKPTTYHKRLCDKVRNLLSIDNLDRGIPKDEIFHSSCIASKLNELQKLIDISNDKDKEIYLKHFDQLVVYLNKALEYEEKEKICGDERNSYYKTDHDATAMCLKEDYYSGLGSNMHAAYNTQIVVSKGFVFAYYVSQSRNDTKDFIPTIEEFCHYLKIKPKRICADSGYGSTYNYQYLKDNGIENYVKHKSWQGNISGKNPNQYRIENEKIYCLNNKEAILTSDIERHPKNANTKFYKIEGCNTCPFKTYCKRFQNNKDEDFKIFEINFEYAKSIQESEDNLLSIKGIELRVNRSSQVEGAFGVLKQDIGYTRFRRRSINKVSNEFMLTFLGYNLKKLFRYFDGKLKCDYWIAPEGLVAEIRKKPSAKRLTNKVNKKLQKQPNQIAKKYKYKSKK